MKVLGLVPARGGSKGVPRKNIASIAGKPLIAWTLEAALASGRLDRLMVSTDDDEIAETARRWGAETPFKRPAEISQDLTPGIDPILHAMNWLEREQGYLPELVMLLQPTSPLRRSEDITGSLHLFENRAADAVISVCEVHEHPYRLHKMETSGWLTDFMPEGRRVFTRQQLPPLFFQNGALYAIRRSTLLAERTLFPARTAAYVMPPERSLQIDTPWDLRLCEFALQAGLGPSRGVA